MKFYLQQEGDSLLTPIESSKIGICANKYRIMGQSPLKSGQGVDIRIQYHHPTHPKTYDYHQKINDEGNVIIMPQMQLHPGNWEIHCCSDLIEEIVGKFWENRLYLTVEANPSLYSPIKEGNSYSPQSEAAIQYKSDALPQKGHQPSFIPYSEQLSQITRILDNKVVENLLMQQNNGLESPEMSNHTVDLLLDTSEILCLEGETLEVSGRVEIQNALPNCVEYLQYELRDALTQDIIYSHKQPLFRKSSLLAFQHTLEVPQDCESSELTLIAQVIATTGDILTQSLIKIIRQRLPKPEDYLNYTLELSDVDTKISYIFDIAIEKPPQSLPIAVNLPEPHKNPKLLRPIQKTSNLTLPPRLKPEKSGNKCRFSVKLPHFPQYKL